MVLTHGADLERYRRPDGEEDDYIVYLSGEQLQRRRETYRRHQRHRSSRGLSVGAVGTSSPAFSAPYPLASHYGWHPPAAQYIPPPPDLSAGVTSYQPAGASSDSWGSASNVSSIFSSISPDAFDRLLDVQQSDAHTQTHLRVETVGTQAHEGDAAGEATGVADDSLGVAASMAVTGADSSWVGPRPVTASVGVQVDSSAGQWRPMVPVTRAAQLLATMMQADTVSTPDQLGRRAALLLGVHPTRFVDIDLVTAIAEGIAEYRYEHQSATMLYSQIPLWMGADGTGILGLYQVAVELARRLRRRKEGNGDTTGEVGNSLPEPPIWIN